MKQLKEKLQCSVRKSSTAQTKNQITQRLKVEKMLINPKIFQGMLLIESRFTEYLIIFLRYSKKNYEKEIQSYFEKKNKSNICILTL